MEKFYLKLSLSRLYNLINMELEDKQNLMTHKDGDFNSEADSIHSVERATQRKNKKRDTLTRKDVMQKTIFRALRKEY